MFSHHYAMSALTFALLLLASHAEQSVSESSPLDAPCPASCNENSFVSKLKFTLTVAFVVVLIFEAAKMKLLNRQLLKKVDELLKKNTEHESETKAREPTSADADTRKTSAAELPPQHTKEEVVQTPLRNGLD